MNTTKLPSRAKLAAMSKYLYRCKGARGYVQAESTFDAARRILKRHGADAPLVVRDQLGSIFTQPTKYIGTVMSNGTALENIECAIYKL